MSSATYSLSLPTHVLTHYLNRARLLFVRDRAEAANRELDASIRSGDYFVTLATLLESIAEELPNIHSPVQPALEKLVEDLEYAQRHYSIVKKATAARQSLN